MCGIVAIVSRPSRRPIPTADEVVEQLDRAVAAPTLTAAAHVLSALDSVLHGVPGMLTLVSRHELVASMIARLDQLDGRIADRERELEAGHGLSPEHLSPEDIEHINAELLTVRDAVWALRKDRLNTAQAVGNCC